MKSASFKLLLLSQIEDKLSLLFDRKNCWFELHLKHGCLCFVSADHLFAIAHLRIFACLQYIPNVPTSSAYINMQAL